MVSHAAILNHMRFMQRRFPLQAGDRLLQKTTLSFDASVWECFAPFFAGAAGSGQCWHWDRYVDKMNLWHHFGRFAEIVKGLDPPAEVRLQVLPELGVAKVA